MKIKRIITLILALLALTSVFTSAVSCKDPEFEGDGWVEKNEKTMKSASYKNFSGDKYYPFTVEGTVTVDVEIVTEAGEVGVSVYRKELPDAPIYTIAIAKNDDGKLVANVTKNGELKAVNVDKTFKDSFAVASDGEYIIRIKGSSHKGSYKFDW